VRICQKSDGSLLTSAEENSRLHRNVCMLRSRPHTHTHTHSGIVAVDEVVSQRVFDDRLSAAGQATAPPHCVRSAVRSIDSERLPTKRAA